MGLFLYIVVGVLVVAFVFLWGLYLVLEDEIAELRRDMGHRIHSVGNLRGYHNDNARAHRVENTERIIQLENRTGLILDYFELKEKEVEMPKPPIVITVTKLVKRRRNAK